MSRRVTVSAAGVVDEELAELRLAGSGGLLAVLAGRDDVACVPTESPPPPAGFLPPPGVPRPEGGVVLPDLAERMRAGGGTGMHTTDTVDVVLVVSGAITLELVDGTAVGLAAGDTVVQLGEPHRWVNHGPDPATIALFMVGADH